MSTPFHTGEFRPRRFGRFHITCEQIADRLAPQIYEGLTPVRVEFDFANNRFDVTAHGDCFDAVECNQEVPLYRLSFKGDELHPGRMENWRRVFEKIS